MTSHEKRLIEQLFARLQEAGRVPVRRDGEAQALISAFVQGQPDAPYLMAQTIIAQAQALRAAQESLGSPLSVTDEVYDGTDETDSSRVGDLLPPPGESGSGFLDAATGVAMLVGGAITLERPRS